jgi:hypothetical protein
LLEQIVSQVSLEGSVSAVRWALVNNAEFVAERGVMMKKFFHWFAKRGPSWPPTA